MVAKFYETFIVQDSLLQTISNLVFLCTIIISIICFLKSIASSKSVSETSLTDILFVDLFTAIAFVYNNNEKVLDGALKEKYQIILIALGIFFGVIAVLRQLLKKPLNNGTLLVTDGQGHKQITGEEYKKEFNKRKTKNVILTIIREALKVLSLCSIGIFENLLTKEFVALSAITIDGAVIATISYYSIMIVTGVIIVLIIDWILGKIF